MVQGFKQHLLFHKANSGCENVTASLFCRCRTERLVLIGCTYTGGH